MGTGIANALGVQWGQMTPAQQVLGQLLKGGKSSGTRRRRKGKKKVARVARKRRAKTPRRRAAKRRTGRKSRLVKGSAAAKRYMAKIRRMRKR